MRTIQCEEKKTKFGGEEINTAMSLINQNATCSIGLKILKYEQTRL